MVNMVNLCSVTNSATSQQQSLSLRVAVFVLKTKTPIKTKKSYRKLFQKFFVCFGFCFGFCTLWWEPSSCYLISTGIPCLASSPLNNMDKSVKFPGLWLFIFPGSSLLPNSPQSLISGLKVPFSAKVPSHQRSISGSVLCLLTFVAMDTILL